MTEKRKAVITFDEGSTTEGVVTNIISGRDEGIKGWEIPSNQFIQDCTNYSVEIGQTRWSDGKFLDAAYLKTPEQEISEVKHNQNLLLLGEYEEEPTSTKIEMSSFQLISFMRRLLKLQTDSGEISGDEILEYADILPVFKGGMRVTSGEHICYGEISGRAVVYRVSPSNGGSFITQNNIPPDSPNNPPYTIVGVTNGVRHWARPLGKLDSYQIGEQVWWEGVVKTNAMENNLFSPAEIGWE